jgi:hypothetical protein
MDLPSSGAGDASAISGLELRASLVFSRSGSGAEKIEEVRVAFPMNQA